MSNRILALFAIGVLVACSASAQIHVDVNTPAADGAQDGASWSTAYNEIQEGIDAAYALGGGEVWVAGGTYSEARTEPWGCPVVTGCLVLKTGVHLYGGFEGTETARSQRAVACNETVIDGSVADGGSPAIHTVAVGSDILGDCNPAVEPLTDIVLDGFTVTGGDAAGGAGFHGSRGGGLFNWATNLEVRNCTFDGNTAAESGGAVYNVVDEYMAEPSGASPLYVNCLMANNTAARASASTGAAVGGGAICNDGGTPGVFSGSILFCTIYGNAIGNPSTYLNGDESGGMYNLNGASPLIDSCLVWANVNGGIQNETDFAPAASYTIQYSNVQPSFPESGSNGNISSSPDLADPAGGDYEYDDCTTSAGIDQGNAALDDVWPRDLTGTIRPINDCDIPGASKPDIGCFEHSPDGPVAVCAADTTLTIGPSGSVEVDAAALASDDSTAQAGISKFVASPSVLTCSDIGTPVTVTVSVYDYKCRVATCTSDVTVEDAQDPTAVCQDITVSLDNTSGAGSVTISGGDVDGGSTDDCGITSMTVTPDTFTCADIGANTVTLTVEDGSGNTDVCTATVTVQDTDAPTLACNTVNAVLDASGAVTVTAAQVAGDGASTDNCGIDWANCTVTPNSFDCSHAGTPQTVSVMLVDVNGNSTTGDCTVNVVDNEAPDLGCTDITVQIPASGDAVTVDAGDLIDSATDNSGACGFTEEIWDGSAWVASVDVTCADLGDTDFTIRITDVGGNTDECVGTVTVVDNVDPAITCVDSPATVSLDASGEGTITKAMVIDDADDNCSFTTEIRRLGGTWGDTVAVDCADIPSVQIEARVTDAAGRTATCQTTVPVEDAVAPVAVCKDITRDLNESGTLSITAAADIDDGSSDNCGIASLSLDKRNFNCGDVGTNVVTMTVTDNSGNTSQCTANVEVRDQLIPVIVLDGADPMAVFQNDPYVEPGAIANDNCDGPGNVVTDITGTVDTSILGSYTVTYNYTDGNGNDAVAETRTVNVVDDNPPVITILGDNPLTLECGSGPYADAGATASDVEDGDITGDIVVTGDDLVDTTTPDTYLVNYEVKDSYNTTVSVNRTVTVVDTTPPVITLLGDAEMTVYVGDTFTDPGATLSDDCDTALDAGDIVVGGSVTMSVEGDYTLTYDATDANGLDAVQQSRLVHVVDDTTPPVITLNGGASVEVDCGEGYVDEGATALDDIDGDVTGSINVGGDIEGGGIPADSLPGIYAITYNVSDNRGNAAAQVIRNVTVRSNCAITVDFTADETTGGAPLTVNFTDLSLSDLPVISRMWDFGDGGTSGTRNPEYTYDDEGVYTVTLTVTTEDDSTMAVKTDFITVASGTPLTSEFGLVLMAIALGLAAVVSVTVYRKKEKVESR
jgi:hypothetical protein